MSHQFLDHPLDRSGRLKDAGNALLLTVVVPCFNEEQALHEMPGKLLEVLEHAPMKFEVIYVDDGSTDSTLDLLRDLAREDERIRVIRFSRNFGHQMAITAGLEHSKGDAVVVIDADLQDPPDLILQFLEKWLNGYDVVYGVRSERDGETAFKRWSARIFYRTIDRLSDTRIPLDTGDFRLMDRCVVDALLAMPERDRFVRGMVSWLGFSQIAVSFRRAARKVGVTKFPIFRMIRFAMDGIFSFSIVPLRLATWTGLVASAIALIGIAAAVLEWILGVPGLVRGWTSMMTTMLFIGGVQLIGIGIIGEYVGRIYGEAKRRPLYVLREKIGFESRDVQSAEHRVAPMKVAKG